MLVRFSTVLFASLLVAKDALAALSVSQVVANIGIVTTVSGNLNGAISQLSTSSSPSDVQAAANVSTAAFSLNYPDGQCSTVFRLLKQVLIQSSMISTAIPVPWKALLRLVMQTPRRLKTR
jgi:hypothetical protein